MKRNHLISACALVGGMLTVPAAAALPRIYNGPSDAEGFMYVRELTTPHQTTSPMALGDGVEIIGANLNTGALNRGIYSFNASEGSSFRPLVQNLEVNGGGVYANGKYYAMTYDYDSNFALTISKWMRYDPEVWALEATVDLPLNDYTYIAYDRTYDASTGRTYALSSDRTATTSELSLTDLATGKNTLVGNFPENLFMICIAADGKGHLYTLDKLANLYSVNPETAAVTLIGNTNIFEQYESDYTQSMTYDPVTGMIYWTEFHTEGMFTPKSAIYRINPTNAVTEKICDLPNRSEFTGIFIPDQGVAGAPAAPGSLTAKRKSAGSNDVMFTFTAPVTTTDGKSLGTTPLSFEIMVDGETIDFVDDVTPGAEVKTGYYTLTTGLHTVKIHAENEVGLGNNAAVRVFAGYDVPGMPTDVKQVVSGNSVSLSWKAPVSGLFGGDVKAPVSYKVVRMPGNVTVTTTQATSYSETLTNPGYYYYTVTASSTHGTGGSASSQGAVVGSFTVPYTESFDTPDSFNLYTVFDLNDDERTWGYATAENCLRYSYSVMNKAEDMIITPGISMNSAKSYALGFDLFKYLNGYQETVEVWFGSEANPAKMTRLTTISDMAVDPTHYSLFLAPSATGTYYIGFKAVSEHNQMFIYLDNISVTENGVSTVPALISDLTATPQGDGYKDIRLDFTAPTTTLYGSKLSSLIKIDIYRGNSSTPLHTFTAPTPGSKLSYTDRNLNVGAYTYRVVSANADGDSPATDIKSFAGIDMPLPATDAILKLEGGHPVVSWTAPKSGVNGGPLAGVLSYKIVRMVNMTENATFEISGDQTSYTDDYNVSEQAHLYYAVIASTQSGDASAAYTEALVVGEPYEAPYLESFTNGATDTNPWFISRISGTGNGWSPVTKSSNMDPSVRPYDSDGGMAEFDGYHIWADESRLISPRINLSNLIDPTLTFAFYHYRGDSWSGSIGPEYVKETMKIEISIEGGDYEEIPGANYTLYGSANGWKVYTVALDNFAKGRYVNLAFRGKSGNTYNMYLDKIEITGEHKPSGVDEVAESRLNISGQTGCIIYSGLESGRNLRIISVAGITVAEKNEQEGIIVVPAGIYVATDGENTCRILVK